MFPKKQIFQLDVLKKLLTQENSCVSLIPTRRSLALPPCFLTDIKKGIFFILNNALKKYDQTLDGILIGYQNVKIIMDDRTGLIPMGVAEIRVNISVEFYIFQPKIHGFLEGVVNKKSNQHIGCLVHKYFNATILKPDNVDFNSWNCKDINETDKIKFQVSDIDFTGVLPRIEGILLDSDSNDNKNDYGIETCNSKGEKNTGSSGENYEKDLLQSDEFWETKLSSKNWTSSLSNLDSNAKVKSKKRKLESPSSSASEMSDIDNDNIKNNLYHNKKKRKKNSEEYGTSEVPPTIQDDRQVFESPQSMKKKSAGEEVLDGSLLIDKKVHENYKISKDSEIAEKREGEIISINVQKKGHKKRRVKDNETNPTNVGLQPLGPTTLTDIAPKKQKVKVNKLEDSKEVKQYDSDKITSKSREHKKLKLANINGLEAGRVRRNTGGEDESEVNVPVTSIEEIKKVKAKKSDDSRKTKQNSFEGKSGDQSRCKSIDSSCLKNRSSPVGGQLDSTKIIGNLSESEITVQSLLAETIKMFSGTNEKPKNGSKKKSKLDKIKKERGGSNTLSSSVTKITEQTSDELIFDEIDSKTTSFFKVQSSTPLSSHNNLSGRLKRERSKSETETESTTSQKKFKKFKADKGEDNESETVDSLYNKLLKDAMSSVNKIAIETNVKHPKKMEKFRTNKKDNKLKEEELNERNGASGGIESIGSEGKKHHKKKKKKKEKVDKCESAISDMLSRYLAESEKKVKLDDYSNKQLKESKKQKKENNKLKMKGEIAS